MKSFSVLTVSKRTGWEEMAVRSIARQTRRPKHWRIITSELKDTHGSIHKYMGALSIPDTPWAKNGFLVDCSLEPSPRRLSNLNASLNYGLRSLGPANEKYAHTAWPDYVIFYQDFIDLPEDCFEKLLELATPKTFVTTCTPNYNGTDDGRFTGCNLPRPCTPAEWEANVAIAPMQLLRELGGFWTELDWGWAWDNVDLAERAAMLGAKFICDESNRPKLYPHEMSSHETLPLNGERCAKHIRDIRAGRMPINVGEI